MGYLTGLIGLEGVVIWHCLVWRKLRQVVLGTSPFHAREHDSGTRLPLRFLRFLRFLCFFSQPFGS